MTKGKMYIVEWRDHYSTAGWHDKKDPGVDHDFILKTIGFYVSKNKSYINLAMTDGEFAYGDIMSILRNNILSITEIEEE
jgi:hypothetical protein